MKAKLPFLKKPEDASDELEENSEADESSLQDDVTGSTDLSEIEDTDEAQEEAAASNQSLIHKLKAKIQSLSAKPAKTKTTDEAPVEDDEAAKKKKRSRIIQGIIGVALVAFLAEDYIVPKEEPVEAPVPPPRARPRPEVKPVDPAVAPPTETAPTEVTPTEPTATTPTETTPTEVTPSETTPTESVATEPSTSTETLPDSPVDVTSTEVPSEQPSDTPVEEPVTTPDTTITDSQPTSVDSIDGEGTTTTDDNLTDQILQDLEKQAKTTQPKETVKEYVAPPDYEFRGRGLVYNCVGKHWACIDAPSYKVCEDNASSTKFLKKSSECHPVNVYETQKGCENIQNRMVSTSAKTNFCE